MVSAAFKYMSPKQQRRSLPSLLFYPSFMPRAKHPPVIFEEKTLIAAEIFEFPNLDGLYSLVTWMKNWHQQQKRILFLRHYILETGTHVKKLTSYGYTRGKCWYILHNYSVFDTAYFCRFTKMNLYIQYKEQSRTRCILFWVYIIGFMLIRALMVF